MKIPDFGMNEISIFVRISESGGFTAAAEQLGISRSGVAKCVARLEERLGVQLFHRTTRSLSLTQEGLLFREGCLRALGELEDVVTGFSRQRSSLSGWLRVSLPIVFGPRWVLPELLAITRQHPDLKLDVSFTNRRVDLIHEGIDLAIRIGDLPDSATLVARQLGAQTAVVCAAPAYLRTHGTPQTLGDLDHHDCIVYGHAGYAAPWSFLDDEGKPLEKTVPARHRFDHAQAILDCALQGMGLAYLAEWLVQDHARAGRLQIVLPEVEAPGFPVYALWPKTRYLAPKVRAVVDELVARFAPVAPWACQEAAEPHQEQDPKELACAAEAGLWQKANPEELV